jgi:hypothetical protein
MSGLRSLDEVKINAPVFEIVKPGQDSRHQMEPLAPQHL